MSSTCSTVADEYNPSVQVDFVGRLFVTIMYSGLSFTTEQMQEAFKGSFLSILQGLSKHHAQGLSLSHFT